MIRWAVFLFLLTGFCGCAHRFRSTTTAQREEARSTQWNDTAAVATQASSTSAKVEAVRKVRRRTVTKPDGTKIVTETTEDRGTTATSTSTAASSSASTTTGADFRSARASSSSARDTSTETRLPWFRIGMGIAVAGIAFAFFLYWKARRMRLR